MLVPEFLAEKQVAFETLLHPPAFTAQKRARFLHIPGKQVAKTLLLAGPRSFVLAVLPSTYHIDTEMLAVAFGGAVRLANGQEIADLFRDCEWGVVPPFGTPYGLNTIVDDSIDGESSLVFETTTHAEAIRMKYCDFERLEMPRRLHFARR